MRKGTIYIISGPSGVGKGTIIRELLKSRPLLKLSVSATTRPPRAGEKNGIDYFFLSPEIFEQAICKDDFLEWCPVHSHKYGTLKSEVMKQVDKGVDVLLEIDVQGALKVKEKLPEAVSIFIAPPHMDSLKERLKDRNTEDQDEIERRLAIAQTELSFQNRYDYRIVNATVEHSVKEILKIIERRSLVL